MIKHDFKLMANKRKVTLSLLPLLTLVGCFEVEVSDKTVLTHEFNPPPPPKIESFTKQDKELISDLKESDGFYRSSFETSFEQAKLIGTTFNQADWAKEVNNSGEALTPLFKDLKGADLAQTVLANAAWFSFAERSLSKYNSLQDDLYLQEEPEDQLFYNSIMNESYKTAIEAKYNGSITDWREKVKKQGEAITSIVYSNSETIKGRAEKVIIYNIWNDVEGRNLAIGQLLDSYKQAKSHGFDSDLRGWMKSLASTDTNFANPELALVAAGLLGVKAWNGLFNPNSNNLSTKFYKDKVGSGGGGVHMGGSSSAASFSNVRNTTNQSVRGVSISRGGFGGMARGGAGG